MSCPLVDGFDGAFGAASAAAPKTTVSKTNRRHVGRQLNLIAFMRGMTCLLRILHAAEPETTRPIVAWTHQEQLSVLTVLIGLREVPD